MGQFQDKNMEPRVKFDENSDNGLNIVNQYIPQELLSEILLYTDHATLLNCQLVCKRWKVLIQSYVWRKKTEMILKRSMPLDMPWSVLYAICKKKPFERNLLKNHSGKDGVEKNWRVLSQGGDHWKVECPPQGAPLLPVTVEVFEGRQNCFATSYYSCSKEQTVDLLAEGLTSRILDFLQPPIVVSEWYSSRWDCPAVYECCVKLLSRSNRVLDTFQFHDTIVGEKQNQWLYVSHKFVNYGPGVKKVSFYHSGVDKSFWAGHYGSKMAGACVCVKLPEKRTFEYDCDYKRLQYDWPL